MGVLRKLGGDDRIRTGDKGFADPRLNHLATSPLPAHPMRTQPTRTAAYMSLDLCP
jgi:hypothetical protein